MQLKDTVGKMLSDDYKENFQAEIEQLYIRICSLEEYISRIEGDEVVPKRFISLEVLEMQHKTMQAYLTALLYRASLEGIEIRINA